MIVDAHAHVWTIDPARYPWQPTFGFVPSDDALPEDLLQSMDRHDVEYTVLVQPSAYGSDHRFLLDTVRANPARFVAVGLVDPADAADTVRAVRLVRDGACVGLRINLSLDLREAGRQAEGSGWDELEALGIPLCVRVTPAHRELLLLILGRDGSSRIVVDHLGLPALGRLAHAAESLEELARFERCCLKVAGLARFSQEPAPYRDTWPLVHAAFRAFGSSRLVWGSDFPDGGVSEGYQGAIRAMQSMPFLNAADRTRLMSQTTRELWRSPGVGGTS